MKYLFIWFASSSLISTILSTINWIETDEVGNTMYYEIMFYICMGVIAIINAIEKKKLYHYNYTERSYPMKYSDWIREQPCAVCKSFNMVTAHHVRNQHSGMSKKPSDDNVIPLCWKCHYELHYTGQKTFAKKNYIDYEELINYYRRIYEMQS